MENTLEITVFILFDKLIIMD